MVCFVSYAGPLYTFSSLPYPDEPLNATSGGMIRFPCAAIIRHARKKNSSWKSSPSTFKGLVRSKVALSNRFMAKLKRFTSKGSGASVPVFFRRSPSVALDRREQRHVLGELAAELHALEAAPRVAGVARRRLRDRCYPQTALSAAHGALQYF